VGHYSGDEWDREGEIYRIEQCYNIGKVSGSAICGFSYNFSGNSNYYLEGSATDGDKYATILTTT